MEDSASVTWRGGRISSREGHVSDRNVGWPISFMKFINDAAGKHMSRVAELSPGQAVKVRDAMAVAGFLDSASAQALLADVEPRVASELPPFWTNPEPDE